MNSLASSSKWPSYDSLPSTCSFLLSESDQTEDEADVFSEGEGDSGIRKPDSQDEEFAYLDFPSRPDQLRDNSEQSLGKRKHHDSASSPRAATLRSAAATPGDLAFAQKCADLHRFIHPLLELFHGLKTGRFDRGLNSFQQSVAIDRLQRILGILQKPEMGERYLHNLLQIEVLLKMWFPQVAFKLIDSQETNSSPELLPHHWSENQLNIPVKKRKLCWSDPKQAGKVTSKHNPRPYGKYWRSHAFAATVDTVSTCRPGSPKRRRTEKQEMPHTAGDWLRVVTQDCSVSSSNIGTTSDSP